MFAKSTKKNGHFRLGMRITPEGVDLGEVTNEHLVLLKADASIVLSDVPFESVAVDAALSQPSADPVAEGQDEVEAQVTSDAEAKAEASAKPKPAKKPANKK